MNSLKALAATCALAAAAATAPCSAAVVSSHGAAAYHGPVGPVARVSGPAGRSSLGGDHRSHLIGAAGDSGLAGDSRAAWRPALGRGHGRRGYGGYGWAGGYYGDDLGYPYEAADYGEVGEYGPGPFGPPPPFRGGFAPGYGPMGAPMAPALAPMAYGPGAHDGAYAYGYNGYAQTPALP